MAKHKVLSGIRATGNLHIGNYLGAVKGMIKLQDNSDYQTNFMVADVHTITTPFDPVALAKSRRSVIIDYLACGLDPEKSILFLQSMVPQHLELAFYFSAVTSIARMQHLPTFKDKIKQHPQAATMALLNYPVLMAADILLYQADSVPVGVDQEPHLEITRQIARAINDRFGTSFPEPKRFATSGEYVPSLSGTGKMSKSVANSFINLTDTLSTIETKLKAVPTDSGKGSITPDPKSKLGFIYTDQFGLVSQGVSGLLKLVELFEGENQRQQYDQAYEHEGIRYSELKQQLAGKIFEELKPIQAKRAELDANVDYVDEVIHSGATRAKIKAEQTMIEIRDKIGLG